MALPMGTITLSQVFQNWAMDSTQAGMNALTVDAGVVDILEPILFKDKVMQPSITYATDVHNLMVDARFAVAFIRKLDKIKVTVTTATADGAFRVVPTQANGDFLEIKCNDVLKVGEVLPMPVDAARVSGQYADRLAVAAESYDECREIMYMSYLIGGGNSNDPTDTGAPASPNTNRTAFANPLDPTTGAVNANEVYNSIVADRKILIKQGARPDTLLISPDTEESFLQRIGNRTYITSPSETERAALGAMYQGTLFAGTVRVFSTNVLGDDNSALMGATAGTARWDYTNVEYILYDHRTLSIVNISYFMGVIEYGQIVHNSSLLSIFTITGGRVRNTQRAIAKKFAP